MNRGGRLKTWPEHDAFRTAGQQLARRLERLQANNGVVFVRTKAHGFFRLP